MIETVKSKAEEFRNRVKTRIEEIRGGRSSGSLLSSPADVLKGPLITELKEKGVIATAKARVAKLRAGGLATMLASESPAISVEKDSGIKFQRGRIAVE